MLEQRLVIAGLYAKPELKRRAAYYRRKIDKTLSFAFQSFSPLPTDVTVDAVWGYRVRGDRLRALDNALTSAVGLLTDAERAVVELTFFCGYPRTKVAARMGVDEHERIRTLRRAIRHLGRTLEMLGFSTKRFLDYFDTEPVIITAAEHWKKWEEDECRNSAKCC